MVEEAVEEVLELVHKAADEISSGTDEFDFLAEREYGENSKDHDIALIRSQLGQINS